MTEEGRRIEDKSVMARAAHTAKASSKTFWTWAEDHHIDSLVVMIITLGLTYRVVEWSLYFPYAPVAGLSGTDKAAIIAAILTPWGIMQGAMFKFYAELKRKDGASTVDDKETR